MGDLISRESAISAVNKINPTKEGLLEPSEVFAALFKLPSVNDPVDLSDMVDYSNGRGSKMMGAFEPVFSECTRNIPCIDCDNTRCWFQGKKGSDCPKYKCDRPKEFRLDCDHCDFIDRFIEDLRKENELSQHNA